MKVFTAMPLFAANNDSEAMQWFKAFLIVAVLFALMMVSKGAFASDGVEFDDAADKVEGWIKGNLGKLAAFICVGVGVVVAAIKKDFSWFLGSLVIAIGVGIVVGIINASFTATI